MLPAAFAVGPLPVASRSLQSTRVLIQRSLFHSPASPFPCTHVRIDLPCPVNHAFWSMSGSQILQKSSFTQDHTSSNLCSFTSASCPLSCLYSVFCSAFSPSTHRHLHHKQISPRLIAMPSFASSLASALIPLASYTHGAMVRSTFVAGKGSPAAKKSHPGWSLWTSHLLVSVGAYLDVSVT